MASARRPKTGGRRTGTPDRTPRRMTGRSREHLWTYCEQSGANPFEVLATVMQRSRNQALRVVCAKELATYLMPRLSSVQVQGDPEQPVVHEIKVTLE